MAIHTIQSQDVRVEVDPLFGARVLSLIDRRSGRDWMAKGPKSLQVGEDAVYLADEAVGWDECFPTVARWDASDTSWGRRLRDHGDLWGRPWALKAQSEDSVTLSYSDKAFRFTRRLSIHKAVLTAEYAVENIADAPLPFMWALHGLLAVTPDDRTSLPGVDSVASSYVSLNGSPIEAPRLAWPGANSALGIALDAVQPVSSHFAAKLYASHIASARASVGGRNGWLDIGWDNRELGHLGLWLNYGGWPSPGNIHHLALEPTTAPVDHLGQALEQGSAVILAPASISSWSVTLTLRPPPSSSN
ncbi:MAG: hypothetical protein ABI398_14090 [Devosia sp.]